MDNLAWDPSSTTSASSLHCTGISLFQFPTSVNPDESRQPLTIPTGLQTKHLPDSYAFVPALAFDTVNITVPESTICPIKTCIDEAVRGEKGWYDYALLRLEKQDIREDTNAWAAYHASQEAIDGNIPALTALLPLFYKKAATPVMVKHGMDVLRQAITFLNPGQIPVITVDQPLFAITKYIQWKLPEQYGEKVYVVMLGDMHTEMTL